MSKRYGDETRIRGWTQNCQIGWKLSNCGQFRQLVLKFGQIRQIERILKAICIALLELLMCFLFLLICKRLNVTTKFPFNWKIFQINWIGNEEAFSILAD